MKNYRKDERGIAHVEIIVIVVVVLAVAGFIGWRVLGQGGSKSSDSTATDKATQQALKAECEKIDDDDLCKFFTSWKSSTKYRMIATGDGQTSTFEIDGDNSRISVTGEMTYDVITIGKSTYTKAGDVWYKQTIKDPEDDVSKEYKQDFTEPDESTPEADKTTYKKHGKEACGNLSCFKYEVVDPKQADVKEFIWFDDKDYQLRKVSHDGPDGKSEMTFEYSNVSVKEPSPVKELGPDQYIVPGQSEPMTIPSLQ
jgi:outer membrane lipoprotein-sorting protein